jgi:lysozyme
MPINVNKKMLSGIAGAAALLAAAFIMPFEGSDPVAHLDPAGVPEICYGHTHGVKIGDKTSPEKCMVILGEDTQIADAAVARLVTVKITDTTRAAFISFVFNAGAGNFARSTMLKKLNAGKISEACLEFPRWVYAKGKKLPGLARRRQAERDLCLKGIVKDVR